MKSLQKTNIYKLKSFCVNFSGKEGIRNNMGVQGQGGWHRKFSLLDSPLLQLLQTSCRTACAGFLGKHAMLNALRLRTTQRAHAMLSPNNASFNAPSVVLDVRMQCRPKCGTLPTTSPC